MAWLTAPNAANKSSRTSTALLFLFRDSENLDYCLELLGVLFQLNEIFCILIDLAYVNSLKLCGFLYMSIYYFP